MLKGSEKKINVLFLVLAMSVGGLERIVSQMIKTIDKKKFEPYLCCLDSGGVFLDDLIKNGFQNFFLLNRKPGPFDLRLLINLCKILRDKKIDVIHSQNGCSLYAAVAGRLSKVKAIIHTDHGRLMPDQISAIWEDRLSSYFINKVVGVSTELTEYLRLRIKIKERKLCTIINGVDLQEFRPIDMTKKSAARKEVGIVDNNKILGTVCRLDSIKNVTFLITAMHSIVNTIPCSRLIVIGDGPEKRNLEKYAKKIGVAQYISFFGQRDDLAQLMGIFDIYVSSSLSEGTSMTILEAMASGLPVVASDVGGNKSLITKSNGFLYLLNDEGSFCKIVTNLLKSPNAIRTLGINSRKRAEKNFSLELMIKKYEKLYLHFSSDRVP